MNQSVAAFLLLLLLILSGGVFLKWKAEREFPLQESILNGYVPEKPENGKEALQSITSRPIVASLHYAEYGKALLYSNSGANENPNERKTRLAEAQRQFKAALKENPAASENIALLGLAFLEEGNVHEGLTCLAKAIQLEPGNYFNRILFGIGVSAHVDEFPELSRRFYLDSAEREIKRGWEIFPPAMENPVIVSAMAKIYLRQGRMDDAFAMLSKVSEPTNEKYPYLLKLAHWYAYYGELSLSARHYRLFLDKNALAASAREEVFSSLERDAKAHGNSVDLKVLLGENYLKRGEREKAKQEFLSVVSQDSRHADTQFLLGVIAEEEGNAREAYSFLLRALEISPNHPQANERIIPYRLRGFSENHVR